MIKRLLSLFAVCLLASATFAHADAIGTTWQDLHTESKRLLRRTGPFGTMPLSRRQPVSRQSYSKR